MSANNIDLILLPKHVLSIPLKKSKMNKLFTKEGKNVNRGTIFIGISRF